MSEHGSPLQESDMVEPAPEIIMAANGIYWRRYDESLSMVPTSTDNDPVLTPYAVYRLVGYEDHAGALTPSQRDCQALARERDEAWAEVERLEARLASEGIADDE